MLPSGGDRAMPPFANHGSTRNLICAVCARGFSRRETFSRSHYPRAQNFNRDLFFYAAFFYVALLSLRGFVAAEEIEKFPPP